MNQNSSPDQIRAQVQPPAEAAESSGGERIPRDDHDTMLRVSGYALQTVSEGVLIAGADRRIISSNDAFLAITGYSEAEMLGQTCRMLQGPETDPQVVAQIKQATDSQTKFAGEILNYRKDGRIFWNDLTISPVFDRQGQLTHFIGVTRDVTARKKAEAARQEAEAFLRMIIDNLPGMLSYWSPDLRCVFANRRYLEWFGCSAEQARGITMQDLLGEERFRENETQILAVLRGENQQFERRLTLANGGSGYVWIQYIAYRAQGELAGFISMVTDITALKRSESDLDRMAEFLSRTGELAKIGGWELDLRTMKISWTRETFRIAEIDSLVEPSLEEGINLFAPEVRPTIAAAIQAAIDRGTSYDLELPMITAKGRPGWVRTQGFATMENGKATVLRGTFQDITARKKSEEERVLFERKLQETQKLESLGILAGGIAHDFNNILTGILGNASLASTDLPLGSPVQDNLRAIKEGTQRAADLCRQMLAYSGKGRFVVTNLSLNRLIEETTHLLQLSISKQAVLRFNLYPTLPAITADATQIRQIIMNLVINASEAIGEKSGVISLTTGLTRVDHAYLGGTVLAPEMPEGTYIYLEVSDSGSGMSPETRAKIFDPFFTTKFSGRGLGLAAVLGIVRGHKGALKVYSELGRGTTFKLLFPCATDGVDPVGPRSATNPAWRGQGCVLVADDEESVRSSVASMLRKLGFEVVLASDGREAVAVFGAEPDRFEFVLMDLTMPHVDGEAAFRELRQIRPALRVVLMSGFSEHEAMSRFAGKGLASFVQKPFDLGELSKVLQDVLGRAEDSR